MSKEYVKMNIVTLESSGLRQILFVNRCRCLNREKEVIPRNLIREFHAP